MVDYAHLLLALGVPTFLLLQKYQAPYAKFSTSSTSHYWGPPIPARWAWFIQETPSLYCSLSAFLYYPTAKAQSSASGNVLCLALYLFHYVVRALIFPFLLSAGSKPTPLFVAALSFAFCIGNGVLQGYSLAHVTEPFSVSEMSVLQWCGVVIFFVGFFATNKLITFYVICVSMRLIRLTIFHMVDCFGLLLLQIIVVN